MTRLGKYAMGALMLAGSALGVAATTTPADARVSIGIGVGAPYGYYGGYDEGYYSPCESRRFRYYHPQYCGYPGYGPSYYDDYGPDYYDGGYGGYGPSFGGVWFGGSFGGHDHWGGGGGHWGGHHH
jgi:hypothetical protein